MQSLTDTPQNDTLKPAASALPDDIITSEQQRAAVLFKEQQQTIFRRTDRWFAYLMIFQWLAGVGAAYFISPLSWSGTFSEQHVHVRAAVVLGGAITVVPVYLAFTNPGAVVTRHVIAIGQMLTSALLIHLTGGRIETHFHVFGSLAFLSFYRDWRVLITASAVIGLDHLLRGIFFPLSVYGTATASPWRWLEHVGWVVFEDIFLTLGIIESTKEMKDIALRRAELELTNQIVEAKVVDRTAQLVQRAQELEELNVKLIQSEAAEYALVKELSRSNSDLEHFAYVASHDLQEPLRKVVSFGDRLRESAGDSLSEDSMDSLQRMQSAATRMKEMIEALMDLSRISSKAAPFVEVNLQEVADQVVSDLESCIEQCQAKVEVGQLPSIEGDHVQLHQLLVNLITNALKFRRSDVPPVVKVHATYSDENIADNKICTLIVEDNGIGFDEQHKERIFLIFQRLHGRGQYEGSGIGLSLCRKIAERHGGDITAESKPGSGASFIVTLPLKQRQTKGDPGATRSKTADNIISR